MYASSAMARVSSMPGAVPAWAASFRSARAIGSSFLPQPVLRVTPTAHTAASRRTSSVFAFIGQTPGEAVGRAQAALSRAKQFTGSAVRLRADVPRARPGTARAGPERRASARAQETHPAPGAG